MDGSFAKMTFGAGIGEHSGYATKHCLLLSNDGAVTTSHQNMTRECDTSAHTHSLPWANGIVPVFPLYIVVVASIIIPILPVEI